MSGAAPRVSIVIPAFNARRWLAQAIDSARAQTHPSCEIIVVDDGSTDGTGPWLTERYADAIRYLRQENRGLAAARNAGLATASGQYVQFLDADDLLLPGKVATHVAALDAHPDHDVAYGDFAFFTDDPERRTPSGFEQRFAEGDVMTPLIRDNFIVVHAALCRVEAIRAAGGFDESLRACEDYDLWLRLAARGARFLYTPGVQVLYRRTPGSMSARASRQIAATICAVEKVSEYANLDAEARVAYRKRLALLRRHLRRATLREVFASLVERVRFAIRLRLRPVEVKRAAELDYWARAAAASGELKADHYEWFYTRHFGLDRSAYAGRRVLDIGCGPRGSLEWASMAALRIGLDPLALDYRALGTGRHAMDYVAAASHALPFPDAVFDIVTSFNSLDHVDDLAGTIEEIVRVLELGGTFLLLAEVNQPATVVEPITLTWNTPALFEEALRPVLARHYEMTPGGLYDAIRDDIVYDHADTRRRTGVLSALFIKI